MRTLGLDLGSREARAVVGEQRRGRWALLESAVQPLPAEAAARAAALTAFVEQHARGARLVVGLPLGEANLRLVGFPATSDENLARLTQTEAESHFGAAPGTLDCGCAVVQPNPGGESTVAVAVCRRERLDVLLAPIHAPGAAPPVVSVDAVALANLYGPLVRAGGVAGAVLHGGPDSCLLVLLDAQGRLRQARILSAGDVLAAEVRRSLQAWAATHGEPMGRVLLSGASAGGDLADLGAPTETVDPWTIFGNGSPGAEHGAAFAVATGLMLQGGDALLPLNLRPAVRPAAEVRRRQTSAVGVGLAGLVLALALAGGWFAQSYRTRQAQAARLAADVARLERELGTTAGESPDYLAQLRTTADQARREAEWIDILRDLVTALPGGVALEEWSGDRERGMVLRGEARAGAAVPQLLADLNAQGRFAGARLDQYDARRVGDQTIFAFQITCPWPARAETGKKGKAAP